MISLFVVSWCERWHSVVGCVMCIHEHDIYMNTVYLGIQLSSMPDSLRNRNIRFVYCFIYSPFRYFYKFSCFPVVFGMWNLPYLCSFVICKKNSQISDVFQNQTEIREIIRNIERINKTIFKADLSLFLCVRKSISNRSKYKIFPTIQSWLELRWMWYPLSVKSSTKRTSENNDQLTSKAV